MNRKNDSSQAFSGGLVVISGPSGSGKTTICRKIRSYACVEMSISATTRPPRPGEEDGRDYFFMSEEAFRKGIAEGEFVEYNEVFGNGVLYGSLKKELERGIADRSRYYLMEIDVQGALNLKDLDYEGRYIFIQPPDMEELEGRLTSRRTEDRNEIRKRLEKSAWEMNQAEKYDKIIINDDLERAIRETEEYLGLV